MRHDDAENAFSARILGEAKRVVVRLALYQPDIPQNAGSLMRLCACLGVAMDIIEPCGFLLSDRNFRRAGMDYLDQPGPDPPCLLGGSSGARRRAGCCC